VFGQRDAFEVKSFDLGELPSLWYQIGRNLEGEESLKLLKSNKTQVKTEKLSKRKKLRFFREKKIEDWLVLTKDKKHHHKLD